MKISLPNSTPQNQLSYSIALKKCVILHRYLARKIPARTLTFGQVVLKHQQQKVYTLRKSSQNKRC